MNEDISLMQHKYNFKFMWRKIKLWFKKIKNLITKQGYLSMTDV